MTTALVTGGNRGIGLEVVKGILAGSPDCHVFVACRDIEGGRKLARSLSQKYGPRVEAIELDVTSQESIARAAAAVAAKAPHLSILVNNAGVMPEADAPGFDAETAGLTMRVNFDGVIAVTAAFLPMVLRAPCGGSILATSSGVGTRTLGLLSEARRKVLTDPSLDVPALRRIVAELVDELRDSACPYHAIPTVAYGLSKLGVNCYTQILARRHPAARINACSPGFCNTGMCANYTGSRVPKEPGLGASVFGKVLFGELGRGRTGTFFKEASQPGTPLAEAVSVVDPWVAPPAVQLP